MVRPKKIVAALVAFLMVFSVVPQRMVFADGNMKNEVMIYDYLVGKLGFNTAAACGVLSNAYYESGFNPGEWGDDDTSYGIFQWHAGRRTNMISFCQQNGYDYTSVNGQLHYFEYDLKCNYKYVWTYLTGVDNSPEGAYKAAYYMCFHYEIPADKETKSVIRGNTARNTYWSRYSVFGG